MADLETLTKKHNNVSHCLTLFNNVFHASQICTYFNSVFDYYLYKKRHHRCLTGLYKLLELLFNPFHATDLFWYPLKKGFLMFSWVNRIKIRRAVCRLKILFCFQPIPCQCFHSIPPDNTRKPSDFWPFQGM